MGNPIIFMIFTLPLLFIKEGYNKFEEYLQVEGLKWKVIYLALVFLIFLVLFTIFYLIT